MLFVDRENELQVIDKELSKQGLSIIILYGRRRIGKTWLLKRIMKKYSDSIYLFVSEGSPQALFRMFLEALKGVCESIDARSWIGLLKALGKCSSRSGGLVLFVDEFQRLGPEFASSLQYYYDYAPDAQIKIVLAGSSVSVVDRLAGALGPLYGRTRLIRLKGFRFLESYVYLRKKLNTSPLEAFKLYCILGRSPYNISLVNSRDWRNVVEDEIHSFYGRLYEEPLHILVSETREPGVYMEILETASGNGAKYSKLASITGKTSLKHYIETLISLGVLQKITPYNYNPMKTRNTWYYVSDPYWDYWLKAVYPKRMEAELTGQVPVTMEVAEEHFSLWFERVVRELLTIIHKKTVKPWWRRDVEIDAVVKNDRGVIVYEVKYKKLVRAELERLIMSLKSKAAKLGEPVEAVGIISLKAPKISEAGVLVHSFEDLLEEALRKKPVRIEDI